MAGRGGASKRDAEKEAYWRKVLMQWSHSGLSQAEFCRQQGLNANTFSSWKTIIQERDAEGPGNGTRNSRGQSTGRPKNNTSASARFVRLEVDNAPLGTVQPQSPSVSQAANTAKNHAAGLAAEIFIPSTDCRVRIYNDANASTLAALISALPLS